MKYTSKLILNGTEYKFGAGGGGGRPDIDTYSVDQTQTIISSPHCIGVSYDGTKLYLMDGASSTSVQQYSMPYGQLNNISAVETTSPGLGGRGNFYCKKEGDKMYATFPTSMSNNVIYQINMPNAYNFTNSTVSSKSGINLSYYAAGTTFSDDGIYVFVCDQDHGKVTRYTLTTPRDITSLDTSSAQTVTLLSNSTYRGGLNISPDGKKLFIGTWGGTIAIYQYDLTTPYDLTSAVYSNKSLSVSGRAYFSLTRDGKYLYHANTNTGVITQYVSSAI